MWDPSFWGESDLETFSLGAACEEDFLRSPAAFTATMRARPRTRSEEGGVSGEATLKGYEGKLDSTGTFDGQHFEITFSSNAFRNRNWRCAALTSLGPLNHYEPLHLHLSGWPKPRHKHKKQQR